MKFLIIVIISLFAFLYDCTAQDNKANYAESYRIEFKGAFVQQITEQLNKLNLGSSNIKKLLCYRYKITEDTIIFQSLNWREKSVDSMVKMAFSNAVDTIKRKFTLSDLYMSKYIYVPIAVFYKINPRKKFEETVSIEPLNEVFEWATMEERKLKVIFEILPPIIYRFPNLPKKAFE